jgi:His/Glu/Gln/Arg/opine family amino acid ABC transporter permease subunit
VIPLAYDFQWGVLRPAISELWSGLWITLELAAVSLVLSLVLGLVVALLRLSPIAPLRWLAALYVWIFRSLSLYIYVIWIYFGFASAFGLNMSQLEAGILALTVMNSAYMAEIYRSALRAVDRGQHEATASLGFSRSRGFVTVILPQAWRVALPSLVNQFVDIVKDSSIVSAIGIQDLFGKTITLVNTDRASFELYSLVGIYYIVLVLALTALSATLERRLSRHLVT